MLSKSYGPLVAALLLGHVDAQALPNFKYYDMPTPGSGPCDVTEGPDGMPWVQEDHTDASPRRFFNNALAQINTTTGKVTEYQIPFTVPALPTVSLPKVPLSGAALLSCALITGADGRLWASNGAHNQIVAMNLTTKAIDVYTPPNILGNLQPLNDITAAPHAMYFTQTTGNVVTRFDLRTHKFKDFEVPTKAAVPLGITRATDGNIWFCEFAASKIGKLDVRTGNITEFPLPAKLASPIVMRAQKGDYLYFCAGSGNSIGRINIYTHEIKAYQVSTPLSLPVEDTLGKDGNVYFTYILRNALGRLNPSTGKIVDIPLGGDVVKGPASVPFFLTEGLFNGPGRNIWFSETLVNRVARYRIP